jgi:WD40 repeat protein/serine/threonine protein kinase
LKQQTALRAAYLDRACADDPDLRRHVEKMLAAQVQAGSFLEQPAPGPLAIVREEMIPEGPGTVLGPYQLLEEIGEGGFGVVFLAEQIQPVHRKVALKILKPGMDTRQIVARFEAERQALAIMDHPHIAQVFDGGATPSGRPYFVMELVKGAPITDYCDQHRLTPGQRLELFILVCQAVQHAHQKGIIHRDLKPSNVLVSRHEATPIVKVIDFGVAKALGQNLTDKTLCTGSTQMIGTPLYASPEQTGASDLDVDTRSDVYSLGVLLYELLTGTTPFEKERFKQATLEEMRRIIREEEPPKPSTRLSASKDALATLSAQRRTEPAKLTRLLRGELDWIIMKALEKDRNRRYETANGFGMDVQRYLANEPVLAGPPSRRYQLRKFVTRHTKALAMVVLLGLALLSAAAVSTTSLVQQSAALAREAAINDRLERTLYFQTVNLAERARSTGQVRLAEELLLSCRPVLRGWEWDYLQRLRYGTRPPLRHSSHLFSVAISPDGKLLAVAGSDGTITIRDGERLEVLRIIRAHASWARTVAFTPDGQRLVSGGWDGHVRLWDAKNGTLVWDATADDKIQCVAVHPEGRCIASSSHSGNVQFWHANTGVPLAAIENRPCNLFALAFSPDGQFLAGGGSDRRVKIWRTEDRTLMQELNPQREQILGLAFSPDGRCLAAASGGFYENEQHGELCVWEIESGRLLHQLNNSGPGGSTFCVAFSPDGRRLAAGGSADPTVKVWDAATGLPAITLQGHSDAIWSLAFSPDGYHLFSASGDHALRVWDATPTSARPGSERSILTEFGSEVHGIAFHPNSRLLATACPQGDLQVWDALTGQVVHTLKVPGTCCVAFSRSGSWLAAGSFGDVRVWETTSWKLAYEFHTHDVVRALSFHPASDQLAAATGKSVAIWDLTTSAPLLVVGDHSNFLLCATYHPDGQSLASAGFEGEVKVWNVGKGLPLKRPGGLAFPSSPISLWATVWSIKRIMPARNLSGHVGRVSCLAYSPDGRYLVSAGVDGVFHQWDTNTWTRNTPAIGHRGHVLALAFSPDGTRLVSAGSDATIRVWDANDFHPLFTLRGHADAISGIAHSPDGRFLASVSLDRTVRIWDATPPSDSPLTTMVDPGQ